MTNEEKQIAYQLIDAIKELSKAISLVGMAYIDVNAKKEAKKDVSA